jgi:hypothetical protein
VLGLVIEYVIKHVLAIDNKYPKVNPITNKQVVFVASNAFTRLHPDSLIKLAALNLKL